MSKFNKIIYLLAQKLLKFRLIKYTVLMTALMWVAPFSASATFDFGQPVLDARPFASLGEPLCKQFISDAKASALFDQNKFLSLLGFETGKKNVQPPPPVVVKSIKKIIVTAYSSTPDQTDSSPFITAMGSYVRDGIVAANFLKFGTKVRLPEVYGDKILVVEDRMALRNSHKMDVWMETRQSAVEFGAKHLTVEILQ